MQSLRNFFFLIFSVDRFVRSATERAVVQELGRHPELRDPATGEYPTDRHAQIEASVRGQATSIRRAYYKAIFITAVTVALGVVAGTTLRGLWGVPPKALVYILQGVGASVILGATLAEIGGQIETWKRESVAEQINELAFRGLYILGTFLFVVSVAWDAT